MTNDDYFDRLYAENLDPWDLESSDYERRKLALLLAALPEPRYTSAFEPGCAIGVTTAALAPRCDRLLALDGSAAAVVQATARVAARASTRHVVIRKGRVPRDWPHARFDLIVLSELLYYLEASERARVADRVVDSLLPAGDVALVHWRHPFAEATTTGDTVHAELAQRFDRGGLTPLVDHVEEDFLLQVYRRTRPPQ